MTRLIRVIAVSCALFAAADCARAQKSACGFTISRSSPPPQFQGAADVVGRTLVPAQPGSPAQIVGVDLNGVGNIINSESGGSYGVQVTNVSDRPLQNIAISISFMMRREGGSLAARLDGPLDPGQTAWVRGLGHVRVSPGDQTTMRIVVAVESAVLDDCFYRPAQAGPLERLVQPGLAPPNRQ